MGGGKKETTDLFIDYKLGEKVNILIKVFNNLPLSSNDDPVGFEDYCCIYLMVWINEYYLDLYSSDYVYIIVLIVDVLEVKWKNILL